MYTSLGFRGILGLNGLIMVRAGELELDCASWGVFVSFCDLWLYLFTYASYIVILYLYFLDYCGTYALKERLLKGFYEWIPFVHTGAIGLGVWEKELSFHFIYTYLNILFERREMWEWRQLSFQLMSLHSWVNFHFGNAWGSICTVSPSLFTMYVHVCTCTSVGSVCICLQKRIYTYTLCSVVRLIFKLERHSTNVLS